MDRSNLTSAEKSYGDISTRDGSTTWSSWKSFDESLNLTWKNICLSVPKRRPSRISCVSASSSRERTVLSDVSGTSQSGQLVGIIGSSGSGKTSLLKILAGRADGKHSAVTGEVYVNGTPRDVGAFRYQHAYVDQDDAMFGELTVQEQVSFNAQLRLASDMPKHEKEIIVDQVLTELGLNEIRTSKIGGKFIRGISGGERKRVSIACEIITQPQMIFLDEPTTGLDSFGALSVVTKLRELATNNRTVICTLHQPRSAIFSMIDQVLILSEGKVVYHGPTYQCESYFSSLGFRSPKLYNPADYLIDLTSVDYRSKHSESISRLRLNYLIDQFNKKRENIVATHLETRKKTEKMLKNEAHNWSVEFVRLIQRGLKLLTRARVPNLMRLFQAVVFGVLLGGVWFGKGRDKDLSARRSLPGILFFIAINQSGAAFSVLFSFPLERTVITRERAANMYRTSSYLIAKTLMDFMKSVIFVFAFCIIIYFMVGLRSGFSSFIQFSAVVLLMTVFAESLSFCVSLLTGDPQTSSSLMTVLIVLFLLFGGFFIEMTQMPSWLAIFKWTSCMYYTYNALMDVEFPPNSNDSIVQTVRRESGLNSLSYTANMTALFGMILATRVIAYFLLRYLRAPKFLHF